MPKLEFKGKKYNYGPNYKKTKTIKDLATKLKVDVKILKDIEKGKNTTRYLKEEATNKIIKYDIRKQPIAYRDFTNKKRINNKTFTSNKTTIPGFTINKKLIGSNQVALYTVFTFQISEDIVERKFDGIFEIQSNQKVNEQFKRDVIYEKYLQPNFPNQYSPEAIIEILEFNIFDTFKNKSIELVNQKMRKLNPTNIDSIFNEPLEEVKGHCIHTWLNNKFNSGKRVKLGKKLIEKCHTTQDIYDLCESKNIKMIAYDVNKNVIKSFYPPKKSNFSPIIYICYENHCYPLKNQILKKHNYNVHHIFETFDECQDKLKSILYENAHPDVLKTDGDKITAFFYEGTTYAYNPDYEDAKFFLESFGLLDQLEVIDNKFSVVKKISKLYIKSNIDSVFPNLHNFKRGGFNYSNIELDKSETTTIDKNLCYSAALKKLPFLIKCNFINTVPVSTMKSEIQDEYLYNIVPKYSSLLIPESGIYAGYILKEANKEGIEFTIKEGFQAWKEKNYFKEMIEDFENKGLVKSHRRFFKNAINIFIGMFEHNGIAGQKKEFKKFGDDSELSTVDGFEAELDVKGKKHKFKYDYKQYTMLKNNAPISLQIKDEARIMVYKLIKELKVNNSNLIQVKTDSFTFNKKLSIANKRLLKDIIGTDINQWKYEKYKPVLDTFNYTGNFLALTKYGDMDMYVSPDNAIGNNYAGCGKTHHIINELIPQLVQQKKSYIVMSSQHTAINTYRQQNINNKIICSYTKGVPEEDVIIIDEFGLLPVKAIQIICEWAYLGKTIKAFGDFKQMLPASEYYENSCSLYLKKIFPNSVDLSTNWRNNFTNKYYDTLINGTRKYCIKEVKKHRNEYSNNVITYRKSVRDKYNQIISRKLGFNSMLDIGVKVICTDNELRKYNIYNKFVMYVKYKDLDEETVTLTDNVSIEVTIDIKKYIKHFQYGYARTVYGFQGDTLDDWYFPDDDFEFLTPRMAYTAISRIRT